MGEELRWNGLLNSLMGASLGYCMFHSTDEDEDVYVNMHAAHDRRGVDANSIKTTGK